MTPQSSVCVSSSVFKSFQLTATWVLFSDGCAAASAVAESVGSRCACKEISGLPSLIQTAGMQQRRESSHYPCYEPRYLLQLKFFILRCISVLSERKSYTSNSPTSLLVVINAALQRCWKVRNPHPLSLRGATH